MSNPPGYQLHAGDEYLTSSEHAAGQSQSVLDETEPSSSRTLSPPPYSPTAPENDFDPAPGRNSQKYDQKTSGHPLSVPLMQQQRQIKQTTLVINPSELNRLLSGGQPCPSVGDPEQTELQVINIQVMPEQQPPTIVRSKSYVAHIVFSCSVIWCCGLFGVLFGLIAFLLALCANNNSGNGKVKKANSCGTASIILSVIGAVLGCIFLIVFIIKKEQAG